MRLFLAVLEGPNPKDATPIFATEDPELIRSVAEALSQRMGGETAARILQRAGFTRPSDPSDA